MQIENIILSHDNRGISALRKYLPVNCYAEAAMSVLKNIKRHPRPAIITTGFYIPGAKAPETDGPPGAIAISRALNALGVDVIYVTDKFTQSLFTDDITGKSDVIDFPIADHDISEQIARNLVNDIQPSIIVAIERCGLTRNKTYLNMAGKDITEQTAKIDYLFFGRENTLGIGDGGNEIGMGNLAQYIPAVDSLPDDPALTTVTTLLIASISNWGGYGLVAALSRIVKKNLLPSIDWEKDIIKHCVAKGAVDGVSGRQIHAVDSFDLEKNAWALTQLNQLLKEELV
jgi:hypothetical protein